MKDLTFKELSERKQELEKFLQIAKTVPVRQSGSHRRCGGCLANKVKLAISLEKSGAHDLVDDMIKEFRERLQ